MKCAELLEAEGRSLRASSIQVGLAMAAILTASFTAVGAVGFFVAALYMSLTPALGPVGSALICGLICTGVAAIFVLVGRRIVK